MSAQAELLPPEPPKPMTAADVRACLRKRWPDSECIVIDEAPSPDGRRIDMLAIHTWASRSHELDAIEIKVSVSDWRRELAKAAKADWWWRHTHRFWVAVPADLATKIKDEIPDGWGLLACTHDAKPRVVHQPPKRTPAPVPWKATVAIMRSATAAGASALQRAEQAGYWKGQEAGRKEAERRQAGGLIQHDLNQLRDALARFEQASGVTITTWDAGRIGEAVALVLAARIQPARLTDLLDGTAERLNEHAKSLRALSRTLSTATDLTGVS